MSTIESYIGTFPQSTQEVLWKIHHFIKELVPEAEVLVSYGIPTFKLHGNLVHYGGYKNHIGFYPGPSGIEKFKEQLCAFKGAKGSVQFPLNEEIPFALIEEIVKFRVEENIAKATTKKAMKVCAQGHKYYKTSDCPTCPICEDIRKPEDTFLSKFSGPARRALENIGITSPLALSRFTKKAILQLHGMGPASLPKLEKALSEAGLSWKSE
jgi:uncharacterized protein YdhG (YjbR/CyaY superfamily)